MQDIEVIIPKDFGLELPKINHGYTTNRGQLTDINGIPTPEIKLYNDRTSPAVYIADDKVSYVFSKIDTTSALDTLHRVDMTLVGSNIGIKAFKTEQTPGYTNYFKAHIPNGVVKNKSYSRVVCNEIYPSIDMQYYSNREGLKYYFIVKPGGDPDNIILKFDGATAINVTAVGGLEIVTSIGTLDFEPPHAYRVNPAGNVVPMPWQAKFEAIPASTNEVKFEIHQYDPIMPLFIQVDRGHSQSPQLQGIASLEWSTFYGGDNTEFFYDIQNASNSNKKIPAEDIYIAGKTMAINFPITTGVFQANLSGSVDDAVLIRINDINLDNTWATYYGGTGNDIGFGMTIDNSGLIYVVGSTYSSNFPTLTPVQAFGGGGDAFIFKMNDSGTARDWATTFGSGIAEAFQDIALDNLGNIYAVGRHYGGTGISIPLMNQVGATTYTEGKGIIVKLTTTGSLLWATQFGNKYGCDIRGIDCDANNNFFITGFTHGGNGFIETNPNFPTNPQGLSEAFITKFDVANNIAWSSYIGGTDTEEAWDIAVSNSGNVAVIGTTNSSIGFPVLNPIPTSGSSLSGGAFIGDAFLTAFSNNGTQLWGTYFGGEQDDEGYGITFGGNDYLYATGITRSTNSTFLSPTSSPVGTFTQNTFNGGDDAFISAFDQNFNRIWSTYFGGDKAEEGQALLVSDNNKLYVTGFTNSIGYPSGGNIPFPLSDFIPGVSYYQDKINLTNNPLVGSDGFIARFDLTPLVGIKEVLNDGSTIGVFPNPSSDIFNLNIKLITTNKSVVITVYDLIGKAVYTETIKNPPTQINKSINLNSFSNGMYLLILQLDNDVLSKKLIKQ